MIGAGVTDMIAEAIVARKLETTGHEDLNRFYLHGEAVMGSGCCAMASNTLVRYDRRYLVRNYLY
jgi:hypothetical protein